jgi:hypothetical protein
VRHLGSTAVTMPLSHMRPAPAGRQAVRDVDPSVQLLHLDAPAAFRHAADHTPPASHNLAGDDPVRWRRAACLALVRTDSRVP